MPAESQRATPEALRSHGLTVVILLQKSWRPFVETFLGPLSGLGATASGPTSKALGPFSAAM